MPAIRSRRLRRVLITAWLLSLLLAVAAWGNAQSDAYFSAVSELNSSAMLEQNSELARRVDAYSSDIDLVFTRAAPGRLDEYTTLRDPLDALALLAVPYEGMNLSAVAEPDRPRLLPTRRERTYSVPGWEDPFSLYLGIGLPVAGFATGTLVGSLGGVGGYCGDGGTTYRSDRGPGLTYAYILGGAGLVTCLLTLLTEPERTEIVTIPVHAIALGNDDFSEFEGVALASGGTFTPAPDAEAVVSTLEKLGNILNAAYALDVPVPAESLRRLAEGGGVGSIGGMVMVEHEGVEAQDHASGQLPFVLTR